MPQAAAAPLTLDARLSTVEHDLMQIARRQYALEAFVAELERVTRQKQFHIWNDIVWMMLLDSRDMLVIHLASWTKDLVAPAGFLAQLKISHLTELVATRRATERSDNDAYLRSLLDGYHRSAVARLFPSLSGSPAAASDVDALTDRVRRSTDPLRHDRNRNRAHAFERGKPGTAKMLDFGALRQIVTQYEELLNDIRLVGCGSTLSYHDMNDTDCKSTAEELVDTVLIGHESRQAVVMGGRDRDSYYAWLHEQHGKDAVSAQAFFNDFWE